MMRDCLVEEKLDNITHSLLVIGRNVRMSGKETQHVTYNLLVMG